MAEVNMDFAAAEVYLEVDDKSYLISRVSDKIRAEVGEADDLKIYVKPEDGKAYYTLKNGTVHGSVDL